MKIGRGFILLIVFPVLLATVCGAAEGWQLIAQRPGQLQAMSLLADQTVMISEASRLTVLSDAGNHETLTFKQNERCFLAPDGSHYAIIAYEGGADVVSAAQVRMYRSDGLLLWTMERHHLNDLVVLSSGGAVACHRNISIAEHQVYFIDATGAVVHQVEVPALGQILASPSGDRVLINSGSEGVSLYDELGNYIAALSQAYRMTFSDDGQYCALISLEDIKVYQNGRLIYTGRVNDEIPRGAVFNSDNSRMAMFSDHGLLLVDLPGGRTVMEQSLDVSGQLSFTSVDVSMDGQLLAVGVERDLGAAIKGPQRHPDGQIRLYSDKSIKLYEKAVSYSAWNTTTPRVKFGIDDKELFVLTRDEVIKAGVAEIYGKGGVR